jgi:hypothetical protein
MQLSECNHSSKSKKNMIIDSSSEDGDDNDEVTLMIKTLGKLMIKKSYEKIYGDDKKKIKEETC